MFLGNGRHFWSHSQEDSHIDAIGYKRRTSNVVVGAQCKTVTLKTCSKHVLSSVLNNVITERIYFQMFL